LQNNTYLMMIKVLMIETINRSIRAIVRDWWRSLMPQKKGIASPRQRQQQQQLMSIFERSRRAKIDNDLFLPTILPAAAAGTFFQMTYFKT
jgi:hypothetical protein